MSAPRHTRILIGAAVVLACVAVPAAAASETPPATVGDTGWVSSHSADIASLRRSLSNTRFLTPRAGVRLQTTRPTLRWRGLPGGTTRVNLQVFRIDGRKATTVLSVFSSGKAYRVPSGRLTAEGLYMWRVWPERGRRGYTPKPLGVSFFTTAPKAR